MAAQLTWDGMRIIPCGLAMMIAAMAIVVEWRLHVNLASASVLNLLLVVFVARLFGILAATAASVAAVVSMDFLLIPPLYTLTIADARNWVALGAFETCALVVVRLSTKAELHAKVAIDERTDSQRLYEVSRQMLLFDTSRPAGVQIVDLIQRVFEPEAVILFDSELGRAVRSRGQESPSLDEMEAGTRRAFFTDRSSFDSYTQTWYRAVRLGVRSVGSLGVKSGRLKETTVDSLASLAAIAMERARALQAESAAIAERHTEQLRTSVLDALAHEFKTPLSTIRTASGGLLGTTGLPAQERELVGLIDEASVRLTDLTTRALRTARLDAGEVTPKRVPLELQEVVGRLVASADRSSGHEIVQSVSERSTPLLADGEMLNLGLCQLLDNAIRYSHPDSRITVSAVADEDNVRISVRNLGKDIPVSERVRIFERYYRIPGMAHRANGTGLGLSVAKKIVEAHGGELWVEGEGGVTTFTASLPRYRRINK